VRSGPDVGPVGQVFPTKRFQAERRRGAAGSAGAVSYGFIPSGLLAQVKARFLELYENGRAGCVRR
jgi:hypothetical protein